MRSLLIAATLAATTTLAFAAEPIQGRWKTASGENAAISACGGAYCIKLITGKYTGKSIGKMEGSGDSYKGQITDPTDDKTYSGTARLSGDSLRMKGCVLKILCKSQTWNRLP